jgi:hypothetical protein
MGIFDLPAPLAQLIDGAFAALAGGTVRIALWALLASALSMGLYRLVSDQHQLAVLKADIAAAKARLNDAPPENYSAALASSRALLVLALRHVGKTLGPTLLAGLPVLVVFGFLSQSYSYIQPSPGATVAAVISYEDGRQENIALALPLAEPGLLAEVMPGAHPATAVPVIAKSSWVDWFFGNPAGTLRPASPIRQISFAVEARRFVPFGPDWLAGWEGLFLTLMVTISLAIKFLFRIQ